MENPFFSEYFKFAKSINDYNAITSVISTDYNKSKISELKNKYKEYEESVDILLEQIRALRGLSQEQRQQIRPLVNAVAQKHRSIEKNKYSIDDILYHYCSMHELIDISFVVTFKMGDSWNVNYTSSLRPDRLDTHSNRFMRTNATKNYLVVSSYPYQDEESIKCISTIKRNPSLYGSNIHVVCLEEFMDDILYNIFRYKKERYTNELVLPKPKDELAIVNGQRGIQIEHMYAKVLSNSKNLELINMDNRIKREETAGTFLPAHFEIIMNRIFADLEITSDQVSKVEAEHVGNELGKSDIKVTIQLSNSNTIVKGISIKSSCSEEVSVNEKHAIDYIHALGITDQNVSDAFIEFENARNFSSMNRNLVDALRNYYQDDMHKLQLVNWAVVGDTNDPYRADYVMLHSYNYNSKEPLGHAIKFMSCQEYIDEIMSNDNDKTFGTHLSWTCSHNSNNIQLKAPFNVE